MCSPCSYIYQNVKKGEIAEDQKKANSHNKFFASIPKANKTVATDKTMTKELKSREKAPTANVRLFEKELKMSELNKSLKKSSNNTSH